MAEAECQASLAFLSSVAELGRLVKSEEQGEGKGRGEGAGSC